MQQQVVDADPQPGTDGEPLGCLLVALQPRLRRFLAQLRRGGDADVDDLVQETAARAWRSRAAFDPHRGTGEAWLFRIAFRAFLDARAAARPAEGLSSEHASTEPGPEATATARDAAAKWLGGLPLRERTVLLRFHRDGAAIAQIAGEMRLPAGTVKSLLHRARARLWQRHGDGVQVGGRGGGA